MSVPSTDFPTIHPSRPNAAGFTTGWTPRQEVLWSWPDPLAIPRFAVHDIDGDGLERFTRWVAF